MSEILPVLILIQIFLAAAEIKYTEGWTDTISFKYPSVLCATRIHGNGINSAVAPPQSCNKILYYKYGNAV
jgi:hypothetical protein